MSTKSETEPPTAAVAETSTEASPLFIPSSEPFTFTLRRAALSDIPCMASLAASAYLSSPRRDFLSPGCYAYLGEHTYGYSQRIRYRMLSPRCASVIAISSTGLPVGYAQFVRHGNDPAALEHERRGNTWGFAFTKLWLYARFAWDYLTFKDRSASPQAMKLLMASGDFWRGEIPRRWHAQSVVVSPGHQRRGIGKALMEETMERSRKEGVPLGLEATPKGEQLYTKLGFELKRRLEMVIEGEERWGLMVYWPPGCDRE